MKCYKPDGKLKVGCIEGKNGIQVPMVYHDKVVMESVSYEDIFGPPGRKTSSWKKRKA